MDDITHDEKSIAAAPSSEELVSQIRLGDGAAETLFYERYRKGLLIMLGRRTRDFARAEDLTQDTLITVLNRLRTKGIEKPHMLNSYVHQTAKYMFIGWLRKSDNQVELRESVDEFVKVEESLEDKLEKEQARSAVRKLIGEMSVPRDRELLYRYYVREQTKPLICDALDLSSVHFDRVINRARNRFKILCERGMNYE